MFSGGTIAFILICAFVFGFCATIYISEEFEVKDKKTKASLFAGCFLFVLILGMLIAMNSK